MRGRNRGRNIPRKFIRQKARGRNGSEFFQ